MNELKLCPFCGGKAKCRENSAFGHYIYCTKCNTTSDFYASSAAATKVWNRRVDDE